MTLELAKESLCSSKTCPSPYTRSFHSLNILHLSLPVSEEGYNVHRSYSMKDLLGIWAQDVHHKTCKHDGKKAKETVQKIVGTPKVLVLQLNRLTHTANGARHFVSNPLIINETLDVREHCERQLPTEKLYHDTMKSPPTKYKLRALIRHRGGHFYTYALTPDTEGVLHWARFDDCSERVEWQSPISSIPQNAGQKDDFMFFYERDDPKTGDHITADKKYVGESVGGKAAVGADKLVAILSGKKAASDDQKVADLKKLLDIKKVVDDKKVADDRQKDDLMGTNKEKKKEKKTETDSAGNTLDAVMADHAALIVK